MKIFIPIAPVYTSFRFIILSAVLLISSGLFAQADSAKEEAPAAPELISPSLDFFTVQKGDNSIDLKVALKAKVNGVFYKLPLLKITFIQKTDTAERVLGYLITDKEGKAVFQFKNADADAGGKLHFKALFAGNKQMEPADAEVSIQKARLELVSTKDDSLLTVTASLIVAGAGNHSLVKDVTVGLFVKRMINPLKIGEGTTDETGEANIEVAEHMPGDDKGEVTLLGRLDENEIFGNLETAVILTKWGVPVSSSIEAQPRALWSSHPPLWMLVTFIVLMAVVWGHYLVIVYQLFRLRKEEPHPDDIATIS